MQLRSDFELPEDDRLFLATVPNEWEAVIDGGSRWVLIRGFEPPNGYQPNAVSVAILIPPGYPDVQLDMFYFRPALARIDGQPIKALCSHTIRAEPWQRWSRHRTGNNPWRPGEDDLSSHLMMMRGLLEREFVRLN